MAPRSSLPWSVVYVEDRNFRKILSAALGASLILAALSVYVRLPQAPPDLEREMPARRVRLLPDIPAVAPRKKSTPAARVARRLPQKAINSPVKPAPPVPVETPRAVAKRSGVLAMGDMLTQLQAGAPEAGPRPVRNARAEDVADLPGQSSTLSADVSRGSGGIEGAVDHQLVLGQVGLPDKDKPDNPGGTAGRGEGRSAAHRGGGSGAARSQEQIQEILDRHKGAMYTLYNRELRSDAGLQGKLVLSLTISGDGTVTDCAVISSELDSVTLQRQLVTLVSGINFGSKPGTANVTTRVPIEFFPQ